jgi:hypothetical protein
VDLIFSGKLAPVDIATFSCINQDFSTLSRKTFFGVYFLEINFADFFLFGGNPFVGGTFWATARCCSGPLWVGIPQWMGFSRPQLVVVSASLGRNPSMDGIF